MTPTARSLAYLRKLGFAADVVERFNAYGGPLHMRCPVCKKNRVGTRNDLFGMFDILYLTGSTLVGLQVTSGANHAARVKKIMAEPRAAGWLRTGALIEVWSWQQKGPRGKRKKWECRKEEITLEALP